MFVCGLGLGFTFFISLLELNSISGKQLIILLKYLTCSTLHKHYLKHSLILMKLGSLNKTH